MPVDPAAPPHEPAAGPAVSVGELRRRLADLTLADERRLGRRLSGLRGRRGGRKGSRTPGDGTAGATRDASREADELARLATEVERAEQRIARRRAAVPEIGYPDLPVSARVDDLAAAIRDHQVVIVAGETGSGKSTQLPKICLELGRGVRGTIGHTQPRRIAARALAERIAEETGTELGRQIGYTVRFGDHTGDDTLVKLMTDGILLAEIGRDPLLLRYDTIIIDEAHERSLTIDFLLGYLTRVLPRRPDLRVIVTSATIDPERFARHFAIDGVPAPVVEVSGRTYPVEVRYRPFGEDAEDTDDADEPDDREPDDGGAGAGSAARAGRGQQHPPGRRAPAPEVIDQPTAICRAVDELLAAGPGDVLVFLSGEREITDTAEALRGHLAGRSVAGGGGAEVVPLFGRLSAAEQHRVFAPHTGRRIVLATNVAETSITVPGIRYVVDPGTARISRYSTRTKVQRLPIEKISRASAGQRAGRCGRVADGICIRLYSEEDFLARPEFTDPEIARTSLASVILQMAALDLGDVATFPFVEPPDGRQIADGVKVLDELGALERTEEGGHRLTPVGRRLAALPVDPQYARMIVEADRRGCLAEVLVIVAGLTVQDVREHPLEERDRAAARHARFVDDRSDFAALVNLWHHLHERAEALSGNAFRRMCREEYLHWLRIREWQDLHAQLRQVARSLGMHVERTAAAAGADDGPAAATGRDRRASPSAAQPDRGRRGRRGKGSSAFAAARDAAERAAASGQPGATGAAETSPGASAPAAQGRGSLVVAIDHQAVHTSLLAGLLTHIGLHLEPGREYQGTRGTKFVLWPGSALARAQPRLVVAAELVETSRLWGRTVARIEPTWVEEVGAHLLSRTHSEPRWDAKRGAVVATEKVSLLGVTLVAARTVQYDAIDAELSRELFIRHALVEGDWQTRHPWFSRNADLLATVAEREDRARRRDIVVDDDTLFALYDARIPADVTSGRHLDAWWRKESGENPALLEFTEAELIAAGAQEVAAEQFPDRLSSGGVALDLDYVFEPGRADDGVTVTIPLAVLARVDPDTFTAHVPGHREELAVALLRTLPKSVRRNFVPAPDFARAALARLHAAGADTESDFPRALAEELTALTGIVLRRSDFDLAKLPDHLRMTFRVVDADGGVVRSGKDLSGLQRELRASTRDAVAAAVADSADQRTGLTAFPADGVAPELVTTVGDQQVRAFPALVDEGATVGVRVFATQAEQTRAHRRGVVRALALALPAPSRSRRRGTPQQMMVLATAPHGSDERLLADVVDTALDALLDWAGGPVWTEPDLRRLRERIAPHLDRSVGDVLTAVEAVLAAGNAARLAVAQVQGGALAAAAIDMRGQLEQLLRPGFVRATGAAHLPELERHLQAIAVRAERARTNPDRDRERMAEVIAVQTELDDVVARLPVERHDDPDVLAARRLVQEFRIAQFAQPMRTVVPVSEKRIRTAIAALDDGR